MSTHLTPIQVAECLIAPIGDLGALAGLNEKAAYNWRPASGWRDAGDMPPRVNRRLLAHAAKKNIPLTADHLIWGAPWDEIAALVEGMGKTMPVHLRERRKHEMAAE